MKKWPLSCLCRRLWGARPRLLRAGDEEFDSHLAATLFITRADVGWLLHNERWNITRDCLCHPQLFSNPRTDTPWQAVSVVEQRSPSSTWESTKEPASQKRQRDDTDEPYLGIRGLLEFGGGVLYHFIQFGRACDAWRACRNFGFGDLPKLAWHAQIFGKFSAVKRRRQRKNLYIGHMIAKWIRHTMKIAVTTVTFRHFGGPRDAWLPNWMKWYSMYPSSRFKVWKPLEKHHLTVFVPVSIRHFGRGPYLSVARCKQSEHYWECKPARLSTGNIGMISWLSRYHSYSLRYLGTTYIYSRASYCATSVRSTRTEVSPTLYSCFPYVVLTCLPSIFL